MADWNGVNTMGGKPRVGDRLQAIFTPTRFFHAEHYWHTAVHWIAGRDRGRRDALPHYSGTET